MSARAQTTPDQATPDAFRDTILSRYGEIQVSQAQRLRILNSALAVIGQYGYPGMSVSRVTARAGVSRRTFYDLYKDGEDCLLATLDHVLARIAGLVVPAYQRESQWREQIRSALAALLAFCDEQPGVRSLLFVDVLKAGPAVLERRAQVLGELSAVLHRGGSGAKRGRAVPPLVGEGLVGAVLGVIHTRLLEQRPAATIELLNPLMGMIVLPYLGPGAAQRELERPEPQATRRSRSVSVEENDPLAGLPMRLTYRTLRVVAAIGDRPGASNRQIAQAAGVSDQGQISKLLARLATIGLLQNNGRGQISGEPNAWELTARGHRLRQASHTQPIRSHVSSPRKKARSR